MPITLWTLLVRERKTQNDYVAQIHRKKIHAIYNHDDTLCILTHCQ